MKHLPTALLLLMMVSPVFAAEADLTISRVGTRTVGPARQSTSPARSQSRSCKRR